MKLISCHIDGFGIYINQDFKFDDKLNSYLMTNGKGKSTLTEFIISMLYGMENTSKIKFNTREHYRPFKTKEFGGVLILQDNNNEYKIKREFASKQSNDETKFYINNELKDIKEIGEYLFNLDKESFIKLFIINAKDIEIKATTNINSNLVSILGNLDTTYDISLIEENLTAKIKKLSNKSSGLISLTKQKISNLNNNKASKLEIYDTISNLKTEINDLEKEIKELEIKKETENKKLIIEEKWKYVEDLENRINELKYNINNLLMKYNNIIPNESEIIKIENNLNIIDNNNIYINSFSDQDYLLNKPLFNDLDEEKLNKINDEIINYNIIKNDLENKSLTDEETSLLNRFNNYKPDLNKLEEYKNKCLNNNVKNKYLPYIITCIILALVLISGLVIVSFNLIIGITLVIISIIGLFIDGFIFIKSTKLKNNDLISEINKYALQYGYLYQGDVISLLNNMINDLNIYNNLKEKDNNILKNKLDNLETKLKQIFNKYNIYDNNFTSSYKILIQNYNNFKNLENKYNDYLKNKENKIKENEEIEIVINEFKNKYKIDNISIIDIKKDLISFNSDNEILRNEENKLLNYKKDNNLIDREINDNINIDELNLNLKNLRKELSIKQSKLSENEDEVSDIDDIINDIAVNKELLDKYELDNKLLEKAKNYLIEADNNLKNRYIKPIKNNYSKYAKMLENTLGENIIITKDLELQIMINNVPYKYNHLSSGELSICALCFRLALIDNLGINSFIIFDDSFSNLDSNHFNNVANLIKDLTKDKQILYFTCHESRKIE